MDNQLHLKIFLCNKLNEELNLILFLFLFLLFLSRSGNVCSSCLKRDETSTYDSLASYYNRIGDRFHDCGKWDQLKKRQNLNKRNIPLDDQQNHFHLKQIQTKSSSSNLHTNIMD